MMSAVVAVKRKRLVRRFYEAGAVDPDHAVTLASVGERRTWIFDQMLRYGAFAEAEENRFYLNVALAEQFMRDSRYRALTFIGYLLAVLLVLWTLGVFR